MSRNSPQRRPTRAILSPYAGPMPRIVVPTFASPLRRSAAASKQLVARQHQMGAIRHLQTRCQFVTHGAKFGQLFEQGQRVDHHAVTNDARRIGMQRATWQQVEHCLAAIDHHRVAGVRTTLAAHHVAHLTSQYIDHLTFALVAPLQAENHRIPLHQHLARRRSVRATGWSVGHPRPPASTRSWIFPLHSILCFSEPVAC